MKESERSRGKQESVRRMGRTEWINRYRAEQAERLSVSSESEKGKYEPLDPSPW